MTSPEELAALHASVFSFPRPWTAAEFAAMLASPRHEVLTVPGGLAVIQTIADEAELLTIAVAADARQRGLGSALLARAMKAAAAQGAREMFLEVAADNGPALAFYEGAGFRRSGVRRGYYRDGDRRVDAVLMARALDAA